MTNAKTVTIRIPILVRQDAQVEWDNNPYEGQLGYEPEQWFRYHTLEDSMNYGMYMAVVELPLPVAKPITEVKAKVEEADVTED